MTPNEEPNREVSEHNPLRRDFIKKSLMGGMGLASPALFSGLVRANGGGGGNGGNQQTTVPWGTTVQSTTQPMTTFVTTGLSHCPPHGNECEWVADIGIFFSGVQNPHPNPNHVRATGRVFIGVLRYRVITCDGTMNSNGFASEIRQISVKSGGYLDANDPPELQPGSDTAIPPGTYMLDLDRDGGNIAGFPLEPVGGDTGRTNLEIHSDNFNDGTSGCVGISDNTPNPDPPNSQDDPQNVDWRTLRDTIEEGNLEDCVHNPPTTIEVTVTYTNAQPTYLWNPGQVPPNPGVNPANPNNPSP